VIDRLISEKEAAQITGLSVAWFQRKRWAGGGPPYVKIGRCVRYRETDLVAYIDARAGYLSTSDVTCRRIAQAPSSDDTQSAR
jgi:predicted DNA-binding transcriptional regulator AlpA